MEKTKKSVVRLFVWGYLMLLLSGCTLDPGPLDNMDHLVYGYDNAPWMIHSKKEFQEAVNDTSFNIISRLMSGFGNVDQFLEIYSHHTVSFMENKADYQRYNSFNNTAEYEALCAKHNDRKNPPVSSGAFYKSCYYCPCYDFSAIDFVKLEVFSTEDFDENHAAGSSLLDLLHFATATPNRMLLNNYQISYDTDVLIDHRGKQLFNTYKLGSDVGPEDLTIINFFYLSFDKLPDPIGPRNIKVRLTADDAKVYDFETVLTFQEIE